MEEAKALPSKEVSGDCKYKFCSKRFVIIISVIFLLKIAFIVYHKVLLEEIHQRNTAYFTVKNFSGGHVRIDIESGNCKTKHRLKYVARCKPYSSSCSLLFERDKCKIISIILDDEMKTDKLHPEEEFNLSDFDEFTADSLQFGKFVADVLAEWKPSFCNISHSHKSNHSYDIHMKRIFTENWNNFTSWKLYNPNFIGTETNVINEIQNVFKAYLNCAYRNVYKASGRWKVRFYIRIVHLLPIEDSVKSHFLEWKRISFPFAVIRTTSTNDGSAYIFELSVKEPSKVQKVKPK